MRHIHLPRRLRLLAPSLAAAALIAGSAVVVSANDPATFSACLNPGGQLHSVSINSAPACHGNDTAITWNQVGQQGPAGSQGPQGPAGPVNTSLQPNSMVVPAGAISGSFPFCAGATQKLLSGGWQVDGIDPTFHVTSSYPYVSGSNQGWDVNYDNESTTTHTLTIWLVCAA